mmetsp:Transcript_87144/g.182372  ORF Transcript_87144/g.182372 Transcript_87144/m.182372 type:complete len:85 (-) Transcript_87144:190-444(-)
MGEESLGIFAPLKRRGTRKGRKRRERGVAKSRRRNGEGEGGGEVKGVGAGRDKGARMQVQRTKGGKHTNSKDDARGGGDERILR